MNPLFGRMGQSTQQAAKPQLPQQAVAQVRGMIDNLSALQNPMQALQKVAGKNPLLGTVMNVIGGRDPRQVYLEECQKQGVDPNIIIDALNNR